MAEEQGDVTLRYAAAADIDRVRPLWEALYRHQAEHGMLLKIPDQAFEAWASATAPALGRFAVLALAERDGRIIGFVAGRVRPLPPYFGAQMVGAIGEVFVEESSRSGGVGRRVLAHAVEWFQSQGVTRIELQVVSGNPAAVRFYQQLGWHMELVQMVWTEDGSSAIGDR